MDLKQLEYFVRVAELGSFTRASILLDVAQSALSRQVRLLELEFKQSLLLRNGRGVVTTDAGKLMLEYGRGILHQVERMKEELGRARGALVGNVALGLPPGLLKTLTVPIFREFKQQFPAAKLAIREGLTTSMQESLVSGRLDIALLYNASPSPDIDLTPLFDEELFLVSPKAKDQTDDPILIKDLIEYPLIMPSRPNAIRMLVETELAHYGLRPTVAFEVDGINAILDLVGEQFGYAILPKATVVNFAGNRYFHLTPVVGSPLKAKISLAVNSHRQITATQRALIDLIRKVVIGHLCPSV